MEVFASFINRETNFPIGIKQKESKSHNTATPRNRSNIKTGMLFLRVYLFGRLLLFFIIAVGRLQNGDVVVSVCVRRQRTNLPIRLISSTSALIKVQIFATITGEFSVYPIIAAVTSGLAHMSYTPYC
jgi:hypothetical protein